MPNTACAHRTVTQVILAFAGQVDASIVKTQINKMVVQRISRQFLGELL